MALGEEERSMALHVQRVTGSDHTGRSSCVELYFRYLVAGALKRDSMCVRSKAFGALGFLKPAAACGFIVAMILEESPIAAGGKPCNLGSKQRRDYPTASESFCTAGGVDQIYAKALDLCFSSDLRRDGEFWSLSCHYPVGCWQ